MLRLWAGTAAVLLWAAATAFAQEPAPIGRIKIAYGQASILREGASLPAQAGQPVFEADTLRTGPDGRLGLTLKDDTRLSLGPNSEIRLDRFAYAPAEGRLGFVLKVVRGMAAYVSGQIAKIAPDAVRLETPSAIVGVRGTTVLIRASNR
ncbi:MAG TPA: FecR family protein [Vicinamibacterales bacterium]|nr:FecR family protein [Vicinamibacterales bacterium]